MYKNGQGDAQMTELLLFTLGIKPSILVKGTTDIRFLAKGKYTKPIGTSILISNTPIPELKDTYELGVFLGYYPLSCKLFSTLPQKEIQKGPFLYYNGIHFNTCGLPKEALEWCHKIYGEQMKAYFKNVEYYTYLPSEQTDKIRADRERSFA